MKFLKWPNRPIVQSNPTSEMCLNLWSKTSAILIQEMPKLKGRYPQSLFRTTSYNQDR